MTVKVSKPAINVREELADLRKPTGIAGEAMLRAETPQEQFQLIGAGRRNLLLNGDMRIAQRGTSKTATAAGTYLLDRFQAYSGDFSTYGYTVSQETDSPNGFANSLKYNFDDADTSPSSEHSIYHKMEGQNLQQLQKGTSSAKSVTLSFWCKASLAGTYIAELMDNDNSNRHISKSYSISAVNTWEYKAITFEGDTVGALANDAGNSLGITYWLAANSSNTSGTLQTAWGSLSQGNRAVGQTNLGATANNSFFLTGVQLELGKVATPFEHRSYGEELAACQRYFHRIERAATGANTMATGAVSPSSGLFYIQFPTSMRASPSVTKTGTSYSMYSTASGVQASISNFSISFGPFGTLGGRFLTDKVGDAGNSAWIDLDNDNTYFSFDAEL